MHVLALEKNEVVVLLLVIFTSLLPRTLLYGYAPAPTSIYIIMIAFVSNQNYKILS